MKKIEVFQVDAFSDRLFGGNPAAVCLLQEWCSDEIMQSIGAENNLAETAFVVPRENVFEIRWFTPSVEVDLCGHATLAAAYVLFYCKGYNKSEIVFHSPRSGELKVLKQEDNLLLDFPTDTLEECDCFGQIERCIGILPKRILKGKTDYLAMIDREEDVLNLSPNLNEIAKLKARGLIVTAKGSNADFVSRFFAPQAGVNEDAVTGSAHTSLIPLWSELLGKKEMMAKQLSKRGGELICRYLGNRVLIGGKASLFMQGEIYLNEAKI